ncbi:triose-phosphate isomerase [Marinomonas agarivorans]|nr:triose-phosphate isomerase [Marinomonas agarivorans]
MTRQKIIAGNWKMNGSLSSIEKLISGLRSVAENFDSQVIVSPSHPYLSNVSQLLSGSSIKLAAQNASHETSGAFTGETSVSMLQDFAVDYVLVGHSERRALYGETDDVVAKKTAAILSGELTPILCIGETLEERQKGITVDVCNTQINTVVELVGVEAFKNIVIAYEPVWAIGTGLSATAEQAQEIHKAVRNNLAALNADIGNGVKILYGGSVKASNSADLFAMPDIDGALVGGASLDVDEFVGIIKSAG